MRPTLVRDLGELRRAVAPASILPAVRERLGLDGRVRPRRSPPPAPAATGERYAALRTTIGTLFVSFSERGVTGVRRASSAAAYERAWVRAHGRAIRRGPAPSWLTRPRSARGSVRSLRAELSGLTPFEQAVLRKAAEIPAGEVRTYTWLAREIGHPAAVRAVGSALGRNPMPVVIPCHRVVRTDGRIGDFVYGTPAKRALLRSEGVDPDALETRARAGERYLGSDDTQIFCFPTCRAARRITPKHRVPFESAAAATRSGYRPCKLCRPAG